MKKGRPKKLAFTLGDNPIQACTTAIHEALDQFGYYNYMDKGPQETMDMPVIDRALDALTHEQCRATLLGILRLEKTCPAKRKGCYERFVQSYLSYLDGLPQTEGDRYSYLSKEKRLADHF